MRLHVIDNFDKTSSAIKNSLHFPRSQTINEQLNVHRSRDWIQLDNLIWFSVWCYFHTFKHSNFILFFSFHSVKTDLMENGANSTLFIAKVRKSDTGNYTCSIGPNDFHTINVQVLNGKYSAQLFTIFIWIKMLKFKEHYSKYSDSERLWLGLHFLSKKKNVMINAFIYSQAKVLLNYIMDMQFQYSYKIGFQFWFQQ